MRSLCSSQLGHYRICGIRCATMARTGASLALSALAPSPAEDPPRRLPVNNNATSPEPDDDHLSDGSLMPGQFTPQSDEELEPLVRVQLINSNGEVKAVQDFKLDGSSSEPSLGAIVAFANDTLNVDTNYHLELYLPGSEMPLGRRP